MEQSARIVFADLQGFLVNGQFVLKEFCFSSAATTTTTSLIVPTQPFSYPDANKRHHYIFAPPFPWKFTSAADRRRALWLTSFHHGFYWNDGYTSYACVEQILEPLRQPNQIIYVKGDQKVKWLEELCAGAATGEGAQIDCRNIETIGCPRLSGDDDDAGTERAFCGCNRHRRKTAHCALRNVSLIENWFIHQQQRQQQQQIPQNGRQRG